MKSFYEKGNCERDTRWLICNMEEISSATLLKMWVLNAQIG